MIAEGEEWDESEQEAEGDEEEELEDRAWRKGAREPS